jgi:hypothetical protein
LTQAWRGVLAFVVVALSLTVLWVGLKPGEPNLPRYQGFERQEAGHRPGGSGCDPSRLARLTIPSREAANERDRCTEAAEEYRLKANDLIQQTRSAEAAEAIVGLTYGQSSMAHVGLILGFVTTVAAIAAAIYARQAASETMRSARAAADAADAANKTLAAERAWITWDHFILAHHNESRVQGVFYRDTFAFCSDWKNTGRSPAINLRTYNMVRIVDRDSDDEEVPYFIIDEGQRRTTEGSVGVGRSISGFWIPISDEETEKFRNGQCDVILYSMVEYNDVFFPTVPRISEITLRITQPRGTMWKDGKAETPVVARGVGRQNRIT